MYSPRLAWLLPTMLLYVIVQPMLEPVMTQVEQDFWADSLQPGHGPCADRHSGSASDSVCHDALSKAALAKGIAQGGGAGVGFFALPVLGRLSDSFGRRPVIAFAVALQIAVPAALCAFALWHTSLLWYYVASALH